MGRGSVSPAVLVLRGFAVYKLFRRLGKDRLGAGTLRLPTTRVRPAADGGFWVVVEGGVMRRVRIWAEALGVTPVSSLRPISSKWPMSAMTLPSSLLREWKEEDFELLEVVMPGGEPGLCSMVPTE